MKAVIRHKALGTIVFGVLGAVVVFGIATPVFARFIQNRSSLIFNGVVIAKSGSSLTVATSATTPIVVDVSSRTVYPARMTLADIHLGDVVSINARSMGSGHPLASVVRKMTEPGYGDSGGQVMLEGVVTAKTATTFTVNIGYASVQLTVTSATRFLRSSWSTLQPGDDVRVIGVDSGSVFVARQVNVLS